MDYFDPSLQDLQDTLPDWYAASDPASEMGLLLAALAALADELAAKGETIYADQSLSTATDAALRSEWAPLYGAGNEQLPLDTETLRAYLQARAAEDGTLGGLEEALLALLRRPENNVGTPILFPPAPNLVQDPEETFADPTYWETASSTGTTIEVGPVASALWARRGANALYVKLSSPDTTARTLGVRTSSSSTAGRRLPVTAGLRQVCMVSAKVLQNVVGGTGLLIGLVYFDNTNAQIAGPVTQSFAAPIGSQVDLVAEFTAPAGAVSAYFRVQGNANAHLAGDTLEMLLDCWCVAEVDNVTLPLAQTTYALWAPTTFADDGSGAMATLFQASVERGYLRFAADGSGLVFPADGSGLIFPSNGRLEISPRFADHQIDVTVRNYMAFDRPSFARAVARFRPADNLASTITETAV